MARTDEPSQADVLRDRFSRVPWRHAIRAAVRERTGNGPTALPDRLEGAVFGHLVGQAMGVRRAAAHAGAIGPVSAPASGPASTPESSPDDASLLGVLEALLSLGSGEDDPARGTWTLDDGTSGDQVLSRILAVPLVMRACDVWELADRAARASGAAPEQAEAQVASALCALVVRRLLDGERDRPRVLARASRELRAAWAVRGTPGWSHAAESPAARDAGPAAALTALDGFLARQGRAGGRGPATIFWSAWGAFATASGYREAVTRAATSDGDDGATAALAGGLAGACWGSSAIPAAWRRGLRDRDEARELVDRLVETDAPGWDGRPWRTSTSSPLRVDALDLSGLVDAAGAGPADLSGLVDAAGADCPRGSVGITFLPGKRYVGYHTGAHWRDLDADASRLRELGVDVVLLLVEDRELERCRVTDIGEVLAAAGVDLVRFPIRDPLVPRDGPAFRGTVASLLRRVREGQSLAVACRGGLDRSGMAAACLLREAGLASDEAIARVQRARRGALTLPDQQAFVRAWPPGR